MDRDGRGAQGTQGSCSSLRAEGEKEQISPRDPTSRPKALGPQGDLCLVPPAPHLGSWSCENTHGLSVSPTTPATLGHSQLPPTAEVGEPPPLSCPIGWGGEVRLSQGSREEGGPRRPGRSRDGFGGMWKRPLPDGTSDLPTG